MCVVLALRVSLPMCVYVIGQHFVAATIIRTSIVVGLSAGMRCVYWRGDSRGHGKQTMTDLNVHQFKIPNRVIEIECRIVLDSKKRD